MARLLTWNDPGVTSIEVMNAPITVGSGVSSSMSGFDQTFEGVGDTIVMKFTVTSKRGQAARRERGTFTGLHGGANALRVGFYDPDRMTFGEAGGSGEFVGQSWSNGEPWSNGQLWQPSYPRVSVAEAAAVDAGVIRLADEFWGHSLGLGDWIGFTPLHFGMYQITEVIEEGRYRIWPRLRVALTTDTLCLLDDLVLVMRPLGREAITSRRDLAFTEDTSILLTEVVDLYVRQYFLG